MHRHILYSKAKRKRTQFPTHTRVFKPHPGGTQRNFTWVNPVLHPAPRSVIVRPYWQLGKTLSINFQFPFLILFLIRFLKQQLRPCIYNVLRNLLKKHRNPVIGRACLETDWNIVRWRTESITLELGNRNETRDYARGLGSTLLKVEVFLPPLLSSLVFLIHEILWTLSLRPLH
jgi:hypothetical protein